MYEQMYADFSEKLLPSIQEGLVVTKDYFTDLFGRYVTYLLVTDAINFGMLLLLGIVAAVASMWAYQLTVAAGEYSDEKIGMGVVVAATLLGSILCFAGAYTNAMRVVKDIYVPEVRVYEELKILYSRE